MIAVGLVGCGYWGAKWARNVADSERTDLACVIDSSERNRQEIASRFHAAAFADLGEALAAKELDALIVASPGGCHFEHARLALENGIHCLVEKPLTLTAADALELDRIARERGLTLMPGHTFLFSEPVMELRRRILAGEIGDVLYGYSQRLSLGAFRSDMGAMLDLAPHDLSIAMHVLGGEPVGVCAQLLSVLDDPHDDVSFLNVELDNGATMHIHNSRLDPRKVRQLTLVGSQGMVVYDDTDAAAPLRIYDRSAKAHELLGRGSPNESLAEFRFEQRDGDVLLPKVGASEPLRNELEHFADCVRDGQRPRASARDAALICATLEAARRSSEDGGKRVEVSLG